MLKKFVIGLSSLGIIFLIGYFFYLKYYLPSTIILPSPLANVEFSSEQVQYSADWPDELTFPKEFVLLDSTSGTLTENATNGWSAKFRYQGKPSEATKAISAFFDEKGWIVIEKNKLDSGGFTLLIQHQEGNGVVVLDIDSNNLSNTLILVTLFP